MKGIGYVIKLERHDTEYFEIDGEVMIFENKAEADTVGKMLRPQNESVFVHVRLNGKVERR